MTSPRHHPDFPYWPGFGGWLDPDAPIHYSTATLARDDAELEVLAQYRERRNRPSPAEWGDSSGPAELLTDWDWLPAPSPRPATGTTTIEKLRARHASEVEMAALVLRQPSGPCANCGVKAEPGTHSFADFGTCYVGRRRRSA